MKYNIAVECEKGVKSLKSNFSGEQKQSQIKYAR